MAGALRLFVALELPPVVREELVRWCEGVPGGGDGLRSLAGEDLHLTLCFLGAQAEAQLPGIAAACASVAACPAPELILGEALWLPRRNPRVLSVALVDGDGTAAALQRALATALAAGGWYTPERRPYLPHVTVARVARGGRGGRGGVLSARSLPPPAPLRFAGSRVTVFRSHLHPDGARYSPLASVALRAMR